MKEVKSIKDKMHIKNVVKGLKISTFGGMNSNKQTCCIFVH